MNAQQLLGELSRQGLESLYGIQSAEVSIQKTRKEFEGDFTMVTFPYTRQSRKSPDQLGEELGKYLIENSPFVSAYNVVKGFLNISLSHEFWINYFRSLESEPAPGFRPPLSSGKTIMLEYSSPNTNKPLHLGHVRNILLGYSMSQILKSRGHKVIKTNLVNDRGIHICKSMLAWQKFGHGETPQSSAMKGDHFVGKYYVKFDQAYKLEIAELMARGMSKEDAEKKAPLMLECQEMLRRWESGEKEVVTLWKTMNAWVYEGFNTTYKELGVDFDKIYYESDTYLLGKEVVQEGLERGDFYIKENGSVAVDLSQDGLDEKVLLRADGTSVYMTSDLGTAKARFQEYPEINQLIYTVGNEQDYHFKVLFKILGKLGYGFANECYHLSYGMVELPDGKMKSREGTVVDADDLLSEMYKTAENTTRELGKVEGFSEDELKDLYRMVSLGAVKYFILKVDPKKKMLFNPRESIDFNGHTGPFIQYTHARIKSVLRRAGEYQAEFNITHLLTDEKEIIRCFYDFEDALDEAANTYSPSLIANYAYELTKLYNRFYHELSILKENDDERRAFRLHLSLMTSRFLANAMDLLGIKVPERM
ncbi:MAG TPA: arginine--tRNA ligase [Bacteroidia bacterium]|nr:arginine--tRNA ligase [Bacteroidia bacterium]